MRSSRWHAHGNEYLLVEADTPLTADDARALVESADGIVEVVAVQGNEMQIVIWNPDGSVAEMSGNGTRIAARWLAEQAETATVTVQVGPRNVAARVLADGLVEQDLGQVTVSAPVELEGLTVIPVSVGNPHAVVAGEPADLAWIGPLLEQHPHFPNRTNVQVARVDAPGEVTARVWERGVGETSSSGTSAVAVAAATQPAGGEVVVHFPGGDLRVRLEGNRAYLTGPAERVET